MAENHDEPVEQTIDSKYRKILIAAKRSKQIQRGARPRVQMPNNKSTRVAIEEINRGLVDFEVVGPDDEA